MTDLKEDDDSKNTWTGGKGKDKFEIDDDEDGFAKIKDFNKKKTCLSSMMIMSFGKTAVTS